MDLVNFFSSSSLVGIAVWIGEGRERAVAKAHSLITLGGPLCQKPQECSAGHTPGPGVQSTGALFSLAVKVEARQSNGALFLVSSPIC